MNESRLESMLDDPNYEETKRILARYGVRDTELGDAAEEIWDLYTV